jgi:putative salt-induced outer membrane protein YdiY
MPKTAFIPRALIMAVAICSAAGTRADVVLLKGGDRLSGSIVSKSADTLVLKTAYAGAINIKWSEVESIESAEALNFVLLDGTRMAATASAADESASVVLKSGAILTTAPIALADVGYINPTPEMLGEGVRVHGRANLGLNSNRGNTDNDQLAYDVESIIRSARNRFTIGANGETKQESGSETARNNRGYFKYDHFLSEKWYAYANTDFEEDKYKDLNLRTTIGGGSGYQFMDSPQQSLSLEGGITYLNNDYIAGEDDGYAAGRWALRYMQMLFDGKTQFFHEQEGLLSVEDPDDLIIRLKTGLRFPLVLNLNATIQYNVDWLNNPPADTESTDSAYLISVGYIW